jgi:transcription-repair coupling factor (superfamily II helicase)
MGLSQLYQLRGRVGRSNRTAYAFLMYRRNKMLKETAEKRLEAIAKYTELGSGIRIAMRDLEIRGAGNLLGEQQSGHMEAVGYDLYCKMLNEAVKELKGESTKEQYETAIDINIDAYIPASYIANEFQKLEIYKRIASIESAEECAQMEDELYDRFGDPPRAVTNLLKIALLKCQAHALYITDISQKQNLLKVTLYEKAQLDVAKIPQLIQKNAKRLNFMMDAPPYFEWNMQPPRGKANAKIQVVEQMEELLNELCILKKD